MVALLSVWDVKPGKLYELKFDSMYRGFIGDSPTLSSYPVSWTKEAEMPDIPLDRLSQGDVFLVVETKSYHWDVPDLKVITRRGNVGYLCGFSLLHNRVSLIEASENP